ncbi:aromatic amino acid aminotransferase [Thozetella sp. PMI_491]|nr:aromatic amino acid aminotransferase [Thozetella sp. PMI_491]
MQNQDQLRPKPRSFAHHFSKASKKRAPNVLKEYYRFLRIPEMGNLAGGLPFPGNFPFDTMELLTVAPGSLRGPDPGNSRPEVGNMAASNLRIPRTAAGPNSIRRIDLDTALQYGSAQGYPPLHAWLKKLANSVYHPNIPYDGGADVLINGGSADGLAKIYELLFNPWDQDVNDFSDREGLLVEEFVYAPPIAQIRPKDVNVVPVKMDMEGLLAHGPGGLLDVVKNWDVSRGKMPHVLYLIPTGQNPTSSVLSLPRRQDIYKICSQFDIIIIEDDPYWNLYYASANTNSLKHRGTPVSPNFPADPHHNYLKESLGGRSTGYPFLDELPPSFLSIDNDGRVIRLDSFSKTIAPGCRLGWFTAQPSVCEQLFRITDGTSQQPSGLTQAVVAKLLGDFGGHSHGEAAFVDAGEQAATWGVKGWVDWLAGLRSTNERRMMTMATILEEKRFITNETGRVEMFSFAWPMGGMFLWVQIQIHNHSLASQVDPKRLMLALWTFCTGHPYRILTVPGGDFAATDAVKDTGGFRFLRFCFAAVEERTLSSKTLSFVAACADFWAIADGAKIDDILREDDLLAAATETAGGSTDREVIENW